MLLTNDFDVLKKI